MSLRAGGFFPHALSITRSAIWKSNKKTKLECYEHYFEKPWCPLFGELLEVYSFGSHWGQVLGSHWGQVLYYNISCDMLRLWPVLYGLNIPEPCTT